MNPITEDKDFNFRVFIFSNSKFSSGGCSAVMLDGDHE